MDFIVLMFVGAAIVGVVFRVLFWVGVGKAIAGGLNSGNRGGNWAGPQFPMDPGMQQHMALLNELIRQAQAAQQPGAAGQIDPRLQLRFQTQLLQMQNQMAQMDNLSRQRAETFKAGMLSDATAAGIDVSSLLR